MIVFLFRDGVDRALTIKKERGKRETWLEAEKKYLNRVDLRRQDRRMMIWGT